MFFIYVYGQLSAIKNVLLLYYHQNVVNCYYKIITLRTNHSEVSLDEGLLQTHKHH